MWEILTTLTEETISAALAQCDENGFDKNRGIISLNESFINLNYAKNILVDAIRNKKLVQLPITVQSTLVLYLESISKSLTSLVNGTDEVENLSTYIEQLNTAIWQYGLHNLSAEVLGYQEKMNQLKNQELEIKKLKSELDVAIEKNKVLETIIVDANKTAASLNSLLETSEKNKEQIDEILENSTTSDQSISALQATVQQNETNVTQLLANTKSSNAEVLAIEPKIKEFYDEINEFKEDISTTKKNAQQTVKDNEIETEKLVSNLKTLEDQIKIQIEKATGFSLFHSFQTRQLELAKSKKIWVYALAGLVLASLGVSIFIISSTSKIDVAFFGKLSMSIPLIYAIFFCTVQYSRERKLEEEYAFKSNISISLVPYQELVEKLVNSDQSGEREKYTAFIIDAITKVYTSPTDKIFDSHDQTSIDPMKQLEKAIKAIVGPLEPLIKVIKP
jgi:uncharacterized integral membrane protein